LDFVRERLTCQTRRSTASRRYDMHPEDVMKPDLFSEILLLGGAGLIIASMLLIVVTAITRA